MEDNKRHIIKNHFRRMRIEDKDIDDKLKIYIFKIDKTNLSNFSSLSLSLSLSLFKGF
jgi:hypothetical protein